MAVRQRGGSVPDSDAGPERPLTDRPLSRRRFLQASAGLGALVLLGAAPGLAGAGLSPAQVAAASPKTLRAAAKKLGWHVGCEATGWLFNDARWRSIVRAQFDQISVAWGLFWREIEPKRRGQYDFSVIDRLVTFGRSSGLRIRGDSIVFGHADQVPTWVRDGGFSAPQIGQILEEHVSTVVRRYRGRVAEWVVVNEPYIAPYSTDDPFHAALGYEYIDRAFAAARKADSTAKLNFSDTMNHTADGITTSLTRETVTRLKKLGLVDIVGIQMHIDGSTPPDPTDVLDTLRGYGLPVAITSFDIDTSRVEGTTAERLAVQARVAAAMVGAARQSGVCRDFSVWGIGDTYADRWLQRPGAPLPLATPYDKNLKPKPFYYALRKALS